MTDSSSPDQLTGALHAALADLPVRIRALRLTDGQRVWLKRAEHLTGRMRLQKGDGASGFAREREGLRVLGAMGLPVAPVIAEGPGWFVTPDLGRTLRDHLWQGTEDLTEAFAAGGRALGRLHRAGHVHGRPAIRDICWDGAQARFIDLERFSADRRGLRAQALDVLIFAHSLHADTLALPPGQEAASAREMAIAAYRAEAPAVWDEAARLARWLGWLRPLSRMARKSRDLRAVALTLDGFSRDRE
ncbi:MAG: serine/threonine protein phosphatase [Pseudorhodobacter sp.]